MTTFPPRRTLPSSSSASDAAGEARSVPRPRLEDDPREAPAPDPAAALLSLAARTSHLRAPSPGRGHSRPVHQGSRGRTAAQGPPPVDNELQRAIDETFEETQQAGQRGRSAGGALDDMMAEAMNAVDVMDYNPNVPVDPEYRCHFTLDWVHEPVEWNGRGAADVEAPR